MPVLHLTGGGETYDLLCYMHAGLMSTVSRVDCQQGDAYVVSCEITPEKTICTARRTF